MFACFGLAATPKPVDISDEAFAAQFSGDYYQSYRLYSVLASKHPSEFLKTGLEGFVKSLFVVGSPAVIEKECNQLILTKLSRKSIGAYLCGREYLLAKDYRRATRFLLNVAENDPLFAPAQIMLATVALAKGEISEGLFRVGPERMKMFESKGLGDIAVLTRARIFTFAQRFDEAIKTYQGIKTDSPNYGDALAETSWIFFKQRKLESALVLSDVIINGFESLDSRFKMVKITQAQYFNARYLKGYLFLLQRRIPDAEQMFIALAKDFSDYKSKELPAVERDLGAWNIKSASHFLEDWRGTDAREDVVRRLTYLNAAKKEEDRAREFGLPKEYSASLSNLRQKSEAEFKTVAANQVVELRRALDTFSLKTELGRMEISWIKRADGIRDLDQAIEAYREEVSSIDDFIEAR